MQKNTLFLNTANWIFISGSSQLAHAKIIEKRPKKSQNHLISGPGSEGT
jgi:hypothetical protein